MSSTSSNIEEFTYNELMEQYVKATRLIEHLKSQRNRSKRAFDKAMDLVLKYDARIAELEAAQRWIPVSERLPELEDGVTRNYDVVLSRDNPYFDDIVCVLTRIRRKSISPEWRWLHFWEEGSTPDDLTEYVTHWMPLPQPPEVRE